MANLFKHAAAINRKRDFARLDSEWGSGLKFRTHPDHCPLRGYAQTPPKLAGCQDLPVTSEERASCDAQTLVTARRKVDWKVSFAGLGVFDDAPSPSGVAVPQIMGSFWPSREVMYRQGSYPDVQLEQA